jgi:hypothetical protein
LQEAKKQTGVQQSPQNWGIGCSLLVGISFYWGELKEGEVELVTGSGILLRANSSSLPTDTHALTHFYQRNVDNPQ